MALIGQISRFSLAYTQKQVSKSDKYCPALNLIFGQCDHIISILARFAMLVLAD